MNSELLYRQADGYDLRVCFFASLCAGQIGGAPVLLAKPQTYMNLSGEAVSFSILHVLVPPRAVLFCTVLCCVFSMGEGNCKIIALGRAEPSQSKHHYGKLRICLGNACINYFFFQSDVSWQVKPLASYYKIPPERVLTVWIYNILNASLSSALSLMLNGDCFWFFGMLTVLILFYF